MKKSDFEIVKKALETAEYSEEETTDKIKIIKGLANMPSLLEYLKNGGFDNVTN